jgi:hypothetical protein
LIGPDIRELAATGPSPQRRRAEARGYENQSTD